MSTETAIRLELVAIKQELERLRAEIRAKSATPWPDRLSTTEAVLYVRHAYRSPKFAASTLYRWLREGRGLSNVVHPRRWLRDEIDRLLGGVFCTDEARGARRQKQSAPGGPGQEVKP